MQIRNPRVDEVGDIERVLLAAFSADEGPTIVRLVSELRRDPSARPIFEFVAEEAGEVVGVVLFTKASIFDHAGVSASILAPLAVSPKRQRSGIGRMLVEHGLTAMRECGVDLVFVLGDPAFYSRFGFDAKHGVSPPHELPYPEAWMVRELTPGVVASTSGSLACARSLEPRESW
ncbi:MAG: N-acetyltransferase [Isosphaeraceae bacterium]|nr:N-acetyltransferase [Isosphaeraceae bacterium]